MPQDEVLTIGTNLMQARQRLADITTMIDETTKIDRGLRNAYKWADAPENVMPADVYDAIIKSITGAMHRAGAVLVAAFIEESICKFVVAEWEKKARDAGIEVTNA